MKNDVDTKKSLELSELQKSAAHIFLIFEYLTRNCKLTLSPYINVKKKPFCTIIFHHTRIKLSLANPIVTFFNFS